MPDNGTQWVKHFETLEKNYYQYSKLSVFNNNHHSRLHFKNRRLRSKISSESQISILS
jgi:hypothetical protein